MKYIILKVLEWALFVLVMFAVIAGVLVATVLSIVAWPLIALCFRIDSTNYYRVVRWRNRWL